MTTTLQEVCLVYDEINGGDLNDLAIALSGQHQLARLTIDVHCHQAPMAVPIPSFAQHLCLVHLDLSVNNWGYKLIRTSRRVGKGDNGSYALVSLVQYFWARGHASHI